MDNLIGILLHSVLGAGGGYLGNMLKKNGLSLVMNLIAGAVGGNLGNLLAGAAGLVGNSPSDDYSVAGILSSVLGGGLGSLVGGLFGKKQA